jgi:hypothetical protein
MSLAVPFINFRDNNTGDHDKYGSGTKTVVRKRHSVKFYFIITCSQVNPKTQTITSSIRLKPVAALTFSQSIL